jgi:ArsR family transcriptional regulator, arsenate/arsenite/antimonite-responsive transcriptional repressor
MYKNIEQRPKNAFRTYARKAFLIYTLPNYSEIENYCIKNWLFNSFHRNIAIKEYNYMGITKSEHFTDQQNDLAKLFKAMGHPARVAILEVLLKTEGCICNEIVQELPLAQPTISQHLRELKDAGLIKGNIKGTSICYCIDYEPLMKISDAMLKITNNLKKRLDCC